jgi:putative salt-induced outer membrane protein YdiY
MDFGLAYNFGEDKNIQDEDGDNTTRNDVRVNAAYNYKYTERAYVGAGTKYLYDEIALVDYRLNLNPTLGYFLVKDSTFSFALEGGPGYTFEKVDSIEDNYFSPRIADRFDWIISCTSKLFQSTELLIDVNDSDNYIVNAEIGVEAALSSSLSLVVALRNAFDNQPAASIDKNDLTVISALKVAL